MLLPVVAWANPARSFPPVAGRTRYGWCAFSRSVCRDRGCICLRMIASECFRLCCVILIDQVSRLHESGIRAVKWLRTMMLRIRSTSWPWLSQSQAPKSEHGKKATEHRGSANTKAALSAKSHAGDAGRAMFSPWVRNQQSNAFQNRSAVKVRD